jgi:hypothetical protein
MSELLKQMQSAYLMGDNAAIFNMMPDLMDSVGKTIFELPCEVGEKLFVLAQKEYSVGNDKEYGTCENCDLNEPMKYKLNGMTYNACQKSFDSKCPIVVKPITVDVIEIREDGKPYPCYVVDYEGNSAIEDYFLTKSEAEAELEKRTVIEKT